MLRVSNEARTPVRVDNALMLSSVTRTLKLKVRPESYGWLSAAAVEVNEVFNYCNQISWQTAKRKGRAVRFCGKTFRVFEAHRLEGVTWRQGCFAQDAVGDWWLCLPVEQIVELTAAPEEWAGIDLVRTCSFCGVLSGPAGKDGLVVRQWECSECGAEHDRDQNAARNILYAGLRKRASVRGNEQLHDIIPIESDSRPALAIYRWGACYATA
jgi:Putative transposase DNA-binding domain